MKIFISCGETSGDRYASELVIALKKYDSDIAIFANGGSYLAEQGAVINSHTTMNSTVGFVEPLRHIGFFLGVMSKTKKMILKQKIDVVIIIDHQGFNIPLAKWCKKKNVPVISLFAPQFWMWGNIKRGKQFIKYCDLIATVFSKEHDFYSQIAPDKTMFIGHPLVHELPDKVDSERIVLALFPGSRRQEINHLLPLMISASTKIKKQFPNLRIKLALSSEAFRNEIESQVKDCGIGIEIITNSRELIATSTCSIVSSGTVTLEHALIGTPCVAIYKLHPISYAIARVLVNKKIQENCHGFIAMPNILAKRKILPEFLQGEATQAAICNEITNFLTNYEVKEKIQSDFLILKESLKSQAHPFELLSKYIFNMIKR